MPPRSSTNAPAVDGRRFFPARADRQRTTLSPPLRADFSSHALWALGSHSNLLGTRARLAFRMTWVRFPSRLKPMHTIFLVSTLKSLRRGRPHCAICCLRGAPDSEATESTGALPTKQRRGATCTKRRRLFRCRRRLALTHPEKVPSQFSFQFVTAAPPGHTFFFSLAKTTREQIEEKNINDCKSQSLRHNADFVIADAKIRQRLHGRRKPPNTKSATSSRGKSASATTQWIPEGGRKRWSLTTPDQDLTHPHRTGRIRVIQSSSICPKTDGGTDRR